MYNVFASLKLDIGKRVFLTCTASGQLITALYKHFVKVSRTWPLGRDWGEYLPVRLLYLMVGA